MKLRDVQVSRPPAGVFVDEALVAVLDAHADLERRAREALDDVARCKQALAAAREQDRLALVAALKQGAADPGTKNGDAAEVELAAAERIADALLVATQEAAVDVGDVVAERRDELADEVAGHVAAAKAEVRDVIAKLMTKAAKLDRVAIGEGWLERFPDPAKSTVALRLAGLTAPNGEQRTLAEALAAIDGLLEEPVDEPAVEPVDDELSPGPPVRPLRLAPR